MVGGWVADARPIAAGMALFVWPASSWGLLITFREGTWPQILHVVPSGYGSWFEFADLIFRQCFDVRDCKSPGLKPCSSRDYADSVARPANSVLDNKQLVDIVGPVDDWRTGVIEWCKNRARS